MLSPSTYDDAVSVNAAIEINVLNYNVAKRQGTVPGLKAGNHALASIGFITQHAVHYARWANPLLITG